MYLEHFWLSIIGVFLCGMLCMFGIMMSVDAHRKAKRRRAPLTRGYDPGNPINARGTLARRFAEDEGEWYEVKPVDWR